MTPRENRTIISNIFSSALFLLAISTGQGQALNSPVGTWEVAIKRTQSSTKESGTAYLTFSSDQTMSGYGITTATPGVFTFDGTWALDAQGRVVGNYTEDLNGSMVSGSFIGKARTGRAMQANVVAENGIFKLTGRMPGTIPNFSGPWRGLVTESRTTVAENYELSSSVDHPGVFEITGNGSGPSGPFEISGASILTSKGGVTAFAFSDFQAGGSTVVYLSGKYNTARQTAVLTGVDAYGLRLKAVLSRR